MKKSLLRLLAIVVLAVLAVGAREFYPKLGFQRQCKRPKISINTSDDVVPKGYEIRYSGKTSDGTIVYLLFEDGGRDYSHIMVDNVMYPINGRLTEGWLRADDIILTEDQVVSQWGIEPIGSFDNREKITLITPGGKFIAKKHSPGSDPQMSWNDKILEDTHEYVDIGIVNKNCLPQGRELEEERKIDGIEFLLIYDKNSKRTSKEQRMAINGNTYPVTYSMQLSFGRSYNTPIGYLYNRRGEKWYWNPVETR